MPTPSREEVAALQTAFGKADANSALEGILPSSYQLLQRERLLRGEIGLDDYQRLIVEDAMAFGDAPAFETVERKRYLAGDITIVQYRENVLRAARGAA